MLQPLAYGGRAADTRVALRASNVVTTVSPAYRPAVPEAAILNGPVIRISRAELRGDFRYVNEAAEIVDMESAVHAYRKAAAIERTVDDMSFHLVDKRV